MTNIDEIDYYLVTPLGKLEAYRAEESASSLIASCNPQTDKFTPNVPGLNGIKTNDDLKPYDTEPPIPPGSARYHWD